MKKLTLLAVNLLLINLTQQVFAQAKINNGNNVWQSVEIVPDNIRTVIRYFSMNNFVNNEKYKIVIETSGSSVANNIGLAVNNVGIGNGAEFTYTNTNSSQPFSISFYIKKGIDGLEPGLSQEIKCRIFRKRLGIWDWQTTFSYFAATTCTYNYTINNTSYPNLYSGDYEVSGSLSVIGIASPASSKSVELDGGLSVDLLPGFRTDLSNGGYVDVIIDGCGGAYKTMNLSGNNEEPALEESSNKMSIYPNPVNNVLNLTVPGNYQSEQVLVTIVDMNGRLVFSETKANGLNLQIDVSDLERGLYFISLSNSTMRQTQKLIKQ